MRTSTVVCSLGTLLLLGAACGGGSIDQIQLPSAGAGGTGGSATAGTGGAATGGTSGTATGGTGGSTSGTGGTTGGAGGTGGSITAGASGAPPMSGGVGGSTSGAAGAGGSAGLATGGTAGADVPMGGMAGTEVTSGGMAGTGGSPMGGMAGTGAEAGSGGSAGGGPFDARTGSFKVLAYFNTLGGFTHTAAINTGRTMLTNMATKQGFEVTFSDDPNDFSADNLAQYELVFGLNPTGRGLSETNPAGKVAFEDWMTTKNGAFAGVHSSTDHENGWAFWSEVTGQYYDMHDTCCTSQAIQWEPAAANFIAVTGIPSPWQRSEEWYRFRSWEQWSAKPGFTILSRVTTPGEGTRPVSYIREWSNFRSFYTSLGHEGPTYSDPDFIRHVSAGLMWAVRREALFKP